MSYKIIAVKDDLINKNFSSELAEALNVFKTYPWKRGVVINLMIQARKAEFKERLYVYDLILQKGPKDEKVLLSLLNMFNEENSISRRVEILEVANNHFPDREGIMYGVRLLVEDIHGELRRISNVQPMNREVEKQQEVIKGYRDRLYAIIYARHIS